MPSGGTRGYGSDNEVGATRSIESSVSGSDAGIQLDHFDVAQGAANRVAAEFASGLLTISQAANALSLTESSIRRAVNEGKLKARTRDGKMLIGVLNLVSYASNSKSLSTNSDAQQADGAPTSLTAATLLARLRDQGVLEEAGDHEH